MSIIKDFREFSLKGNFIDLAAGVIIGAASGKVVSSLVDKVIMPPVGLLLGKVSFSDLKIVIQPGRVGPDGQELVKEVAIGYGAAIQSLLDFFIIAFIVFLIMRAMHRFKKKAPPAEQPATEKLLAEIRDILKARS